jgi:hypothetical protein
MSLPKNAPGAAEMGLPDSVPCPFCEGDETELHAAFGGSLSVSTYWCRRCRTAFEWFRQRAADTDTHAN